MLMKLWMESKVKKISLKPNSQDNMAFDSESVLDKVGWQLLRALQEDARLSFSELGRRVGLSSPAVAERVRRMEDMGIVAGYRATIDPTRLGFPTLAFIHLRLNGDQYARVAAMARNLSEVIECHHVTGMDCFLFKVLVSSPAHLEAVIAQLRTFGQTSSSIVLSSPVKSKMLLSGPSVRIEP
jgi:Lrp/AsnC family leucine-responsive transcriptional regulator